MTGIQVSMRQTICRGVVEQRGPGFVMRSCYAGSVVRRRQSMTRSCVVAGMAVAAAPVSPVCLDVTASLFAASTAYAGAITLFLLYKATVEPLRMRRASQGEAIIYSADELQLGRSSALGTSRPSPLRMLVPLIVVYIYLLVQSYEPDMIRLILPGSLKEGFSNGFNPQFFPKIQGIATLFSRVTTTASLWVHLLCINIFAAHQLMWEGIAHGIPTHHTILLSMLCGPVGLLSHALTRMIGGRK